jgi:GH25 family lysozyme M1 (1,4-beta-N-acetylmuramidase)
MAAIYQTGIDVSRYQGTIDWAAVARAGKQFAVIRAVSSNNSGVYVDPMFEKNYAGAKAAGLRVGVYTTPMPKQRATPTGSWRR